MKSEILTAPFSADLVGFSSHVADGCYGEVGRRLMDAMWKEIRDRKLSHKGINHWVYLPDGMMFTGVELSEATDDIGPMERLRIGLKRHAKYLHIGPYTKLYEAWTSVKKELTDAGESLASPSLEIYGHWCEDEAKLETTILISLEPGIIEHN